MGVVMTGVPRARLRVEVARPAQPGATSAPMVMFTVEGRTYAVRVEEDDLDGDLLRVAVVHEEEDRVLVEIPALGEAVLRVIVPTSLLVEDVDRRLLDRLSQHDRAARGAAEDRVVAVL